MKVLLTGGAGYIGSHTALALLERGVEVVVLDDLSNGAREAIHRVQSLTGRSLTFVEADLTDSVAVRQALIGIDFDTVIHFAGLKAVGESVAEPVRYYRTNLGATLTLLDLMRERQVTKLVFSSSATVYGDPTSDLLDESHPVGEGVTNPYARSKVINETIIRDATFAWPELRAIVLRYFNPVGAHPSGRIGEDPTGIPNNLMPYISQVAVGKREKLAVFGNDYATADGSGVRDYIHVMDLAEGHLAALDSDEPGVRVFNLGSGVGVTVLEAVTAFERATGQRVPYEVVARRPGDVARLVADPSLAREALQWQTTRTFEEACRDSWAWQSANPDGYAR